MRLCARAKFIFFGRLRDMFGIEELSTLKQITTYNAYHRKVQWFAIKTVKTGDNYFIYMYETTRPSLGQQSI